jgi:hypothetical protein
MRLGPALRNYHQRVESPLVTPDLSLTREDTLYVGSWETVAPHLALVLGLRIWFAVPSVYSIRVVTDEELRTAYFAKTDKYDDGLELDLRDLVGAWHDMVVIRLGFLGFKNQAMPGILYEVLRLRQAANLPTWLVEDPLEPFRKGHLTFDERVGAYVTKHFRRVVFEEQLP